MRALMIAAAVLVLGTGAAAADGTITISKAVEKSFESYRQALTSVGAGAYAITEDGLGGAGAGCPQADCMNASKAGTTAVKRCEASNPGRKCIIFAKGRDPVLEYKVGE